MINIKLMGFVEAINFPDCQFTYWKNLYDVLEYFQKYGKFRESLQFMAENVKISRDVNKRLDLSIRRSSQEIIWILENTYQSFFNLKKYYEKTDEEMTGQKVFVTLQEKGASFSAKKL